MSSPRVAIVAGCRTPFARSGTVFRDLTALDLARACVRELVERTEVDPGAIGTVVMGQVVPSVKAPNLGREAALGAGLPKSVPAHTVNRACASSNQAIADVASAILLGHVDAGIAGGAECLSDVPDPAQPPHGADPGGGPEGEVARGAPLGLRAAAPARPRPGGAGHRGALDGPDHGPVGGEDGEGERDHPRGAGRDRVRLAPHGPAPPRRTAACPPRPAPCTSRPRTRRW